MSEHYVHSVCVGVVLQAFLATVTEKTHGLHFNPYDPAYPMLVPRTMNASVDQFYLTYNNSREVSAVLSLLCCYWDRDDWLAYGAGTCAVRVQHAAVHAEDLQRCHEPHAARCALRRDSPVTSSGLLECAYAGS